ncbi:hypothetical protein [Polaribacter glomeratus]|uniref:Uncharacterized protein n=1 Tax=Polaribacter glomeratus TaxID=102 RepID=A0A2S7WX46_9FLAO|nr:hypothetical protein [Polaribacter glomeratus]PQJ81852.1 hypothetical protein BTO16_04375 [Polaribacter glomeratus]TXD66224.1 hypothetical protein ESX12_05395 [Polaribacter glomeratus]
MLYIKFTISNQEKFIAFKEVYNHMCAVRKPGYQEKEATIDIDWETATDEDIDSFMDGDRPKIELFNQLFPVYAQEFLSNYFSYDNSKSVLVRADILPYFNYLEYGFEVDLNVLEELQNNEGIVKFSTDNYPYGGMERFLMTLKAFELNPIECFDGFNVYQFQWTSDYEHDAIILSEKTKEYLEFLQTK